MTLPEQDVRTTARPGRADPPPQTRPPAESFDVLPWIQLDTTDIPGSDAKLRLMQRGTEYTIKIGANELMSSRMFGSEEALATLTCFRIKALPDPKILIGGLGMGFTLRAALKVTPPDARLTVVELLPAIVRWGRGPLTELFAGCLDEPRVMLREADVSTVIRASRNSYDAIMLDVDNGPEGLVREGNNALYNLTGLQAAYDALRPGGVMSVWSSGQDVKFTARLRKTGFATEVINVDASGSRGRARHVIWFATKPR